MNQPQLGEAEFQAGAEAAETVFATAAEVDRRGLSEILRGAAYFANREPVPEDLREHLVVEHEIVGVWGEVNFLQQFAGKGAVAGVVFG